MTTDEHFGGSLPVPTGPYPVGRARYHWDGRGSRSDPTASGASEGGGVRELVVWIWYPAESVAAPPAQYLPAGWEAVAGFLGFQADAVASHAVEDAPVAPEPVRLPVLVFSPAGLPPLVLAAILEEMASRGYIVAGINHTYESAVTVFPDGRTVPMDAKLMQPVLGPLSGAPETAFHARSDIADDKAKDMRFVVDRLMELAAQPKGSDRLAGRIDSSRVGSFGHSLGGNAALEHCRLDSRCRAAANLDGATWSAVGRVGVERPVLQLLADHSELALPCEEQVRAGVYPSAAWCEAERTLMRDGWQTVHERAQPGYCALIGRSGHASFLDLGFLPLADESRAAGGMAAVGIHPLRASRITCDFLSAFFGRHLLGDDAPLLDGKLAAFPEVRVGAPRDLLAY